MIRPVTCRGMYFKESSKLAELTRRDRFEWKRVVVPTQASDDAPDQCDPCTPIVNCESVSCASAHDQLCHECALGYAGQQCQHSSEVTCSDSGEPAHDGGCACDDGFLGENCETAARCAEVRAYDAEKTLRSRWSEEVVSASLELSLKCNPDGIPPHDIFQGEPQTRRTGAFRAGRVE